jgi:hypothetical protein
MTWSIMARDRDTGQFGIAVATRFFAVGALVPHVKSRIGAITTQAPGLFRRFRNCAGKARFGVGQIQAEHRADLACLSADAPPDANGARLR